MKDAMDRGLGFPGAVPPETPKRSLAIVAHEEIHQ
jgi:hypothetical protein